MLRLVLVSILRLAALIAMVSAAGASGRVALVIGNSAYEAVTPLTNSINDSRDMAAAFGRLGFDVTLADDLAYDGMRRTLQDFANKAHGADMAVIYYAGHGMEIDHRNYLIPVDARLGTDRSVAFEAIPLELMLAAVDGARDLKIVLLDACRNNPFTARMKLTGGSRSIGRGLSRVEPETGTLVGFAAREGTVAEDGKGRNSPYAAALLSHIEKPGLEISLLFRQVRDAVLEATGNQQEPFTYGSLPGKSLYFTPPPSASNGTVEATRTDTQPTAQPSEDLVAWDAIKDTDSVAVFETYIQKFPSSVYAAFASARLKELKAREQTIPSMQPPADRTGTNGMMAMAPPQPMPKPKPEAAPKPAPSFKLNATCRNWLGKFKRGHKPHAAFAAAGNGSCGWSAGGHSTVAEAVKEALYQCHKQYRDCKIVLTK